MTLPGHLLRFTSAPGNAQTSRAHFDAPRGVGYPIGMKAVIWDPHGDADRSHQRKILGLSHWDRFETTFRRAGVTEYVVARNLTSIPSNSDEPLLILPLSVIVPVAALTSFISTPLPAKSDGRSFNNASTLQDALSSPLWVRPSALQKSSFEWERWTLPPCTWQARIETDTEIQSAEREIVRSVFKPHEDPIGLFLRRLSIPLSRILVRLPIRPNTITIIGAFVALASGVVISAGEYQWVLLGACLAMLSSVLDGCDGEIARIKFQESAFGCWLETVTDYSFYLILFTGLTIGQAVRLGSGFLWMGAALVAGVVVTCILFLHMRHLLSADGKPNEFKGRILKVIERCPAGLRRFLQTSTPLMTRPYVTVIFFCAAVLNLAPLFLAFYALGAQLSWMLSLYVHRLVQQEVQPTFEMAQA